MNIQEHVQKYKVYECVAGSYSYGTQIEGLSDHDSRGVFIGTPSQVLSVASLDGAVQQVQAEQEDEVFYELRKFMKS